jgi:hypothetical protein
MRRPFIRLVLTCSALATVLSACSTFDPDSQSPVAVYKNEEFSTTTTFSREYDASPDETCEAARRTLLSQGYLITQQKPEMVTGRKSFQPEKDSHVEIEFHVVCAASGADGKSATAFANAVQDRYIVKKNANSASLGVSAFGSLSLPFGASDDSLSKIGSETITGRNFYYRFFSLTAQYLDLVPKIPAATTNTTPVATTNTIPVATTNTIPVATTNTIPVATTNITPVATTNITPVATTNTIPVATTNITPVATTNTTPVATTNTTPVATTNTTPVATTTAAPPTAPDINLTPAEH